MAKAYLAVRAEVPEADRAKFDHWYETDHLPWALRVDDLEVSPALGMCG